jgi:hypothetical protein
MGADEDGYKDSFFDNINPHYLFLVGIVLFPFIIYFVMKYMDTDLNNKRILDEEIISEYKLIVFGKGNDTNNRNEPYIIY